jgi:hypothetical protein
MLLRAWKQLLTVGILALATAACAAEEPLEETPAATQDDLQFGEPLVDTDMKKIATPAGMPKPYEQPDSTGWFGARGKCGPTAVANALLLYWISVTPQEADADGVHWLIGTMGSQIQSYMKREHPELGCSLVHPTDGASFLRSRVSTGHPVLVWFNIDGLDSHWVVAVGTRGTGAAEEVIVMSWGAYYAISMTKLVGAWRNVYGIHNPSVVCEDTTVLMH